MSDAEAASEKGQPVKTPADETQAAEERAEETAWARRRRLAAVFGEVLPEQTTDDAPSRGGKGDDWYVEQVPPHHG